MGLQRAFKIAGARSVIMSLWKVDDQTTKEMMTTFYNLWLIDGLSKQAAFKQAQKRMKEKHKDPYHWGAFVLLDQ